MVRKARRKPSVDENRSRVPKRRLEHLSGVQAIWGDMMMCAFLLCKKEIEIPYIITTFTHTSEGEKEKRETHYCSQECLVLDMTLP